MIFTVAIFAFHLHVLEQISMWLGWFVSKLNLQHCQGLGVPLCLGAVSRISQPASPDLGETWGSGDGGACS